MKRMGFLLVVALWALNAHGASGWTGYRVILGLESTPSGLEVRLAGFGGACTQTVEGGIEKTWARITVGQANEKHHTALLLMAYATGKKVDIYCASSAPWASLDNIRTEE